MIKSYISNVDIIYNYTTHIFNIVTNILLIIEFYTKKY